MLRYQTFLGKVEIQEVPTIKTGIPGLRKFPGISTGSLEQFLSNQEHQMPE